MDLFGKIKGAMPFGKGAKAEAQKAPIPEEPHEELPNIKEQVGYLPEAGVAENLAEPTEEFYPEETSAPPEQEESGQFEEPAEEAPLEPAPGEYPSFLPPPPGLPPLPSPEAQQEGLEQEAGEETINEMAEMKNELEEKLEKLSQELEEIKKIGEDTKKISESFEEMRSKYSELEEKISDANKPLEEELADIKERINHLTEIMSSALPALIKEVRDLKEKK